MPRQLTKRTHQGSGDCHVSNAAHTEEIEAIHVSNAAHAEEKFAVSRRARPDEATAELTRVAFTRSLKAGLIYDLADGLK